MEKEVSELNNQVFALKQQLREKEADHKRFNEEITLYKGRCQNLQRDIEMSSTAMEKLHTTKGTVDV